MSESQFLLHSTHDQCWREGHEPMDPWICPGLCHQFRLVLVLVELMLWTSYDQTNIIKVPLPENYW